MTSIFLFLIRCLITTGREDDDDEEMEDLDDDDFELRPTRKPQKRQGTGARRRQSAKASEPEGTRFPVEDSESDSDGDWRDGPTKKLLGRRRRKKGVTRPSKRRRTRDETEDAEVARTARINSRTGGAVNYFESDDDFLDSENEALRPGASHVPVDDGSPRVDSVLDYRPIEKKEPANQEEAPFSDFDPQNVEFNIKWVGKSFRKNTWEAWTTLRDMKGSKRVRNYMKSVEERQAYFRLRKASPEEEEEARILMEENRTAIKVYEVIDRIVAQRNNAEDASKVEYFVKWSNLPYGQCTWELTSDLSSEADLKAIDDYRDREQSALGNSSKKRYNPFSNKEERPRLKRMLEQPSYLHGEGRTLRDYQLEGLNFLAFSWTKRNNVILADEMGLGKTLQTISFLGWLMYSRNVLGPFLVVVPLSTIAAWVREFARWLPDMNVVCYTGNAESRSIIREHEFWVPSKTSTEKFHVLLTTPELLMMDHNYLHEVRWAMVAVDEAHRLKNETSALHITLASLRSANRLLITGTPLQNSVRELWALLHFLNPEIFESAEVFEESFSFAALRDPERVSSLHKTLRPYIIRRQKSDVEKSLPKKTYAVLRVGMTSAQQQYYRWLLTKNFAKLNAGNKARGMGNTQTLRNLVMELKKCCNHPFLFPNYEDTSVTTSVDDLIRASGKMILLDKLLLRLREKGHRVLIFSQMVRMLDILQDYCRMRNFPCQRLDGSIANEVRQRAVDHFNAPDSNDYVFLLSTRAGGLGINLATADTVIIFDSDWNPQNDLQAESRAHRIGQKKDVKVFRLLSRETVEEDILERAKRKRVLEHLVIHGVEGGDQGDGKDAQAAFKKEELSAILRFGAEKLFEKDKENTGDLGVDSKEKGSGEQKENGTGADAPTAQDAYDQDKDGKAEERRVLEVDDIDELLARAPTDEASQVGGAQPSVGDSLLNAFKWADFKTVETEDEAEDEGPETDVMANAAANKLIAIDAEAAKAKKEEEHDKRRLAKEGDSEFWDRVIPGEMRNEALANDMVLGTRRRKRTKTFGADSPHDGKRRRVTRGVRTVMKVTDPDELTAKEQRCLLRSLRKFGDATLITIIVKDAGLEDRIEEELGQAMITDCLDQAKAAVKAARSTGAKKKETDQDPEYNSKVNGRSTTKDSKSKASRVLIDALGETGVDAVDLLKRCDDLKMLRSHIGNFETDTQFRLPRAIKAPTYNVRWKTQNDAMLLVGVYRHGFGNWTRIAQDKQLHLADKMNVAGNTECTPGAPDTTKLTRRVTTLLREVEREVRPKPSAKKASKWDRQEGKVDKKRTPKSQKNSKSRKKDGAVSRGGASSKNTKKSIPSSGMGGMQKALKVSNISTLKELRSLSKENNKLDNPEKIKRTKECLLKLGRAIERQNSSRKVQVDLWRFVHDVCHTSLPGDRLRSIYEKLADVEPSNG